MSILLERILPFTSIVLAVGVLFILILVSTSPVGEVLRTVDVKTQYLSEVAVVLDQQLTSTGGDDARTAAIADLASSLPGNVQTLSGSLGRLHSPEGWLEQIRRSAAYLFNTIDDSDTSLGDPARYEADLADLEVAANRVSLNIDVYLSNRSEFETGRQRFSQQIRTLVQQLRTTGRDDLADQIFRGGNQIQTYALSGEVPRLAQIETVRERLQIVVGSLSRNELSLGEELLASIPMLVDARRAMTRSLQQMDLAELARSIASFRESATDDRVRALSMISDARVLLNLYTVFLLAMLAYLGLRLRASYSALNRSHDELEVRVQERTADLELAYDDLQESQVQLVQAEKMSSLGQLVAGVMHEINTPLLYALNNTSLTTEAVRDLNDYVTATLPLLEARCTDEVKETLQNLLRRRKEFNVENLRESVEEVATLNQDTTEGLNQISDLVQSLKDFSRLDRAAEDKFNVCEGIEKTLTITRNLLKYGVEVEKDFEDVGEILCSPARINQIFVNLVTNAVQAMDGNGTLKITVRDLGDEIEIAFLDTGCGIEPENLSKIMDPFFTTKPVGQGTGLGLSIVHQIVQEHLGNLDIESEIGTGTCITVRLPRHPHNDEEAA